VRRNVDHAWPRRHRLPHETLDLHAIGPGNAARPSSAEPAGAPRVAAEKSADDRRAIEVDSRRLMASHERRLKALASALANDAPPGSYPRASPAALVSPK